MDPSMTTDVYRPPVPSGSPSSSPISRIRASQLIRRAPLNVKRPFAYCMPQNSLPSSPSGQVREPMTPPSVTDLTRMFEIMSTAQRCDRRLRAMITGGEVAATYYSPRGQEAIAAAFGVVLRTDDYLVATYRGLHDHIAKG